MHLRVDVRGSSRPALVLQGLRRASANLPGGISFHAFDVFPYLLSQYPKSETVTPKP